MRFYTLNSDCKLRWWYDAKDDCFMGKSFLFIVEYMYFYDQFELLSIC